MDERAASQLSNGMTMMALGAGLVIGGLWLGLQRGGAGFGTLTAETDPSRLEGGALFVTKPLLVNGQPVGAQQPIVEGPIVVTDLVISSQWASVSVTGTSNCEKPDSPDLFAWTPYDKAEIARAQHGMRLWIPAGKTLCAYTPDKDNLLRVTWSGFRPYGADSPTPPPSASK